MDNIKHELTEATKFWVDKANSIYGIQLPYPRVRMTLRGAVAGRAFYRGEINYNTLIYIQNKEIFLQSTVPHEVAHLVASYLAKGNWLKLKPHGKEWKNVMMAFGVTNITRCHSYDVSQIKRHKAPLDRPFVYTCGCRNFYFTSIKHRRMLNGQNRFCLACHKSLKFVEIKTKEINP